MLLMASLRAPFDSRDASEEQSGVSHCYLVIVHRGRERLRLHSHWVLCIESLNSNQNG